MATSPCHEIRVRFMPMETRSTSGGGVCWLRSASESCSRSIFLGIHANSLHGNTQMIAIPVPISCFLKGIPQVKARFAFHKLSVKHFVQQNALGVVRGGLNQSVEALTNGSCAELYLLLYPRLTYHDNNDDSGSRDCGVHRLLRLPGEQLRISNDSVHGRVLTC